MNSNFVKHLFLVFLSLFATPLLLFISSSNLLYLRNQNDLEHNLQVVFPFVVLFFATLTLGIILYFLSKYRPFIYVIWAYYLIGPFFLIFSSFSEISELFDTPVLMSVFLFLLLTCAIIFARKFNPLIVVKPVAVFSSFLLIGEVFLFVTKYEPYSPSVTDIPDRINQTIRLVDKSVKNKRLPNIYHFVFDGYQTDMFAMTLSPDIRRKLGGFVYFPNNTTVYRLTRMSLASIFALMSYNYNISEKAYQKLAYNSKLSLLYWLRRVGYVTHAYLKFTLSVLKQDLFYPVIWHEFSSSIEAYPDYGTTFWKLWLSKNTPLFIAKRFIEGETIGQIKKLNFLPNSVPIISYLSFLNIMKWEKYLPESNRYTFVHMLIPHPPNMLSADCSYDKNAVTKTTPLEQSKCATKMILDFVDLLKKLKRFDNSLIIINGDHGGGYRVQNNNSVVILEGNSLERYKARSRALLLLKPINAKKSDEFVVSDAETMLIDIGPTIFRSIGIKTPTDFEGISLVNPTPSSVLRRKRYFHVYDKKNFYESSGVMTRYVIENSQLSLDKTIVLKNNKNYKDYLKNEDVPIRFFSK